MAKEVTALLESIDLGNFKFLASTTKRLGNGETTLMHICIL